MKTKMESRRVEELVDWRRNDIAKVNPEYQRGEVWNDHQRKRLVDSVFRGFQLPIIYLHKATTVSYGLQQDRLEIIDGQQRMEALYRFHVGALKLYERDDPDAEFPRFLHETDCPWGGKTFKDLDEELQQAFLNSEIQVAFVESDNNNEIRELFVRLQAGSHLNAQERRDALPGGFCEFILSLGGKPEIVRFPGHRFFPELMGLDPKRKYDRGKTRQMAAQLTGLLLERHLNGKEFTDIRARELNGWYHLYLDFDPDSALCNRISAILDKLLSLMGDGKRRLKGHEAIHLVLFLDSIWKDYTRSWESRLAAAHATFAGLLTQATPTKANPEPEDLYNVWSHYGVWTRNSADRAYTIQRRHRFYVQMMAELLPLVPKDPKRAFNGLEREIIYDRDKGRCAVCGALVDLAEAQIHHVKQHQDGGRTVLENGVLVHQHCHPRSAEQVAALAERLAARAPEPARKKLRDVYEMEELMEGVAHQSAKSGLSAATRL
ncbi:MAG: DUF262 domain-containing protein [Acidobacteriota bacterium]|nr:DUF262 domain-containing protein [Acidobacteriota bacterium]MDE3266668.1 DUF262 domain-containing protein [Acidobacteriota bacterium]